MPENEALKKVRDVEGVVVTDGLRNEVRVPDPQALLVSLDVEECKPDTVEECVPLRMEEDVCDPDVLKDPVTVEDRQKVGEVLEDSVAVEDKHKVGEILTE